MKAVLKNVFLHVCCVLGLFHATRYLMKEKLLILCYHGFETYDEAIFKPKLFITENTFRKRLEIISKYRFPVLMLDEALYKLRNKKLPRNAVVITIDDGFHNILTVAADILNAYQFPATLYLTTYYVKKKSPIFRLVVQYMFWKTKKQEICFNDCVWSKNKNWDVCIVNDNERERLVWECINYGENVCSEQERINICQQLGFLLGVNYQQIFNSKIFSLLTIEEAKLLARKDINIQLHTHRHYFPVDDEAKAKKEIVDNRKVLDEVVDYPPVHFCYPSGIWNKGQWPWLEQMDVQSATTCLPGLNNSAYQALELKRFLDGENISEIEFMAELFGFKELARALRKKTKYFINSVKKSMQYG